MAEGVFDYTRRSAVLLEAAKRYERVAGDPREKDAAAKALFSAAERDSFASLRFEAEQDLPPPASVSSRLSAVLFDLQSANVLLAAGLQTESSKPEGGDLLRHARQEIATSREELLTRDAVPTNFAAALNVQSATVEAAISEFRKYSQQLLDEIVGEVTNTIDVALTELRKLDLGEIGKALKQLGDAVPIVASGGQLLQKGLEKLKRAMEALMVLFGKDALRNTKDQIEQILKQTGVGSGTVMRSLLGAHSVEERIAAILASSGLSAAKIDEACNFLPELAREFNQNSKLLRAILRAIQLASLGLAVLHFAAPWLVPTVGLVYVSMIGVAVLIGRQYTGASHMLAWIDGVEQVAARIP
jgi:hypothetical protein